MLFVLERRRSRRIPKRDPRERSEQSDDARAALRITSPTGNREVASPSNCCECQREKRELRGNSAGRGERCIDRRSVRACYASIILWRRETGIDAAVRCLLSS